MRRRLVTASRLLLLAAALAGRSWGRFSAVVVLLTLSVLVFLSVQAISDASAGTLDASVSSELGTAGEYLIGIEPGVAPADELHRAVLAATRAVPQRNLVVLDSFGTFNVDCTGEQVLGERPLYLLLDAAGRPVPLEPPAEASRACVAGLDIGAHLVAAPPELARSFPEAIFIQQDIAGTVANLSSTPVQREYLLRTGVEADLSQTLRRELLDQLAVPAARAGTDPANAVGVQRLDDGAAVREAASGVRLVYSLIAWAILLMAGTAVALAEMANIRDRNWIFGLARASGATRANIAALVAVDGVLMLAAAALLSALVVVPLAPAVEAFALDAFDYPIRLVTGAAMPQLGMAAAVIILLGAAVPAARAARLDPIDVLERR